MWCYLEIWPGDKQTVKNLEQIFSFWIKRVVSLTATAYCAVCHDYGNIYLPQLLRRYLRSSVQSITADWFHTHYCDLHWVDRPTLDLWRLKNCLLLIEKNTPGPLCSIKYVNRDIEQPFALLSWRDLYWWSSLYTVSFKIDYRMCVINLSIVAFSNGKKVYIEMFFFKRV